MRIAILADPVDNQSAGVHTFTREMIRALLKHDGSNSYFLFRRRGTPSLEGARTVVVPLLKWTLLFPALRRFLIFGILARRYRIDAVIEPAHFGPFFLPKRIKRINIIHDLTPIRFPEYHRFHSRLLQQIFLKRIIRKSNLIIANSDNTRLDLIKEYPFAAQKTERVYPGCKPGFQPKKNPSLLKKYGIKRAYFLFVGTIEPRKNLPLLLKAYQQFRTDTGQNVALVIAGERGWKYQNFFDILDAHPWKQDIILPGYVPDAALPPLYSGALAMIYPSFYEGFGLPVLEAMACGTPCITSNVSSLPEVAGTAALMCNPWDAGDLANQMKRVAEDQNLRDELSARGLKQAARFSWDTFALEFMDLMEQRIGER